jgi:hypothetical protein
LKPAPKAPKLKCKETRDFVDTIISKSFKSFTIQQKSAIEMADDSYITILKIINEYSRKETR